MLNIICLKHGDKYPPVYVNKLYSMTMRHLTVPHRFICFTDNSAGLFPTLEVKMLPKNSEISGWWWKLYLFNEELFSEDDTNFFMDLDTVIVNNIDHLVVLLWSLRDMYDNKYLVSTEEILRITEIKKPVLNKILKRFNIETKRRKCECRE